MDESVFSQWLRSRKGLCLIVGWTIAAAFVAIGWWLFLLPMGPLAVFGLLLVFPPITAFILNEWWAVLLSPVVYWGLVSISSWVTGYVLVGRWPVRALVFTLLSLGGGTIGVVLRRFSSR
jgi:hypothetical protein